MTFHTYSTPDDLGGFSLGVRVPTTDQYKAEIDCMAVPLIAIDQHYNRLGRGGGYYDAYLHNHGTLNTIGLGFSCQYVNHVPHEHHDVPLQRIIIGK